MAYRQFFGGKVCILLLHVSACFTQGAMPAPGPSSPHAGDDQVFATQRMGRIGGAGGVKRRGFVGQQLQAVALRPGGHLRGLLGPQKWLATPA